MSLTKITNSMIQGAVINILDFGADLTGITDSAPAIRLAIAHAKTLIGTPPVPYTDYEYKEYLIIGKGAKSVEINLGTGILRLDSTILTPGCITYKGYGVTIISPNAVPLFETAYYASNVLTSNFGFATEEEAITNSAMSNLRFENISFYEVYQAFRLRVALWQSYIKDCTFTKCAFAIVANSCFYLSCERLYIRGVKLGYETEYAISLGQSTNNVKVTGSTISTRANGIFVQDGGAIQIHSNSFEAITGNALLLSSTVNAVSIYDNYLEEVENFVVDLAAAGALASPTADGAIKNHIHIYDNYCYSVSYYVDLCGLRDSHIGTVVDRFLPDYKCVVRIRGGTNGNDVFVDIPIGISSISKATRYVLYLVGNVIANEYIEGIWSPTLIGSVSAGTANYTVRSGKYTKINNVVNFVINLVWSDHTGTGTFRVSDLPYTQALGFDNPFSTTSYNLGTSPGNILGSIGAGNTTLLNIIQLPTGGGAFSFISVVASGDIQIRGSYMV